MENEIEKRRSEGKSDQDSNPDKSNAGKKNLPDSARLFDPVLARQKALQVENDLWEVLKKTKPERTVKMVQAIPPKYRSRALRTLVGKVSSKTRQKAHCEQCVGWEEVRPRVGGCTVFGCMYWSVRPYQITGDQRG